MTLPEPGVYDDATTDSVITVCDFTTPEKDHIPESAWPADDTGRMVEPAVLPA